MKKTNAAETVELRKYSRLPNLDAIPRSETKSFGKDEISRILGPIYRTEKILSQNISLNADNSFDTEILFPPYDKISCKGDHVSATQITDATIESMYLTLCLTIEQGLFPIAVPRDWFNSCAPHIVLFRSSVMYRKMLHFNEACNLTSELVSIGERRLRKRFLAVVFRHDGFVSGEIEYLIDFNLVPQNFFPSLGI